jgi:hypothetical protein
LQWYDNFLAYKTSLSGNYVYNNTGGASEYKVTTDQAFLGGYLFFDTTYVEINIGVSNSASAGSQTNIQLSLFGKSPFSISNFTFFPLFGIEYDMVYEKENGYGNKFGSQYYSWNFYKDGEITADKMKLSDLNTLWLKLGFGGDIPLSEKIFLRSEYLLGIALLNNSDKNSYEEYYTDSDPAQYEYMINYSQSIRVSIGFRL